MTVRPRTAIIFAACWVISAIGCHTQGRPPTFDGPPVRVVCTTTLIADAVRQVGGDRVAVTTLMGPGVDPHKYLPRLEDRRQLDAAHLVFFNGLHLEGKMADLFEKNAGRWRAYPVTANMPPDRLRPVGADGGEYDPHVWFDVTLWKLAVEVIRDRLAELDPAGADLYRSRAANFLAALDQLDAEVRARLVAVPVDRRVLVTSHDAFGYFGRAYGFEVVGLQGVSTASEVGTARRAELARLLGERKIPAVFTETSVPDEGLKAVLDDTRAQYRHEVRLVGGDEALYSDSLGEPGSPGDTYLGMVRHNVGVVVRALGTTTNP